MAARLSDRAELLLGAVREGSDPETGRVWLPRLKGTYRIYGEDQGTYVAAIRPAAASAATELLLH